MSLQTIFELSSSMINPKHVGLSPFHAPTETRLDTSPPTVSTAMYNYSMCTKRALNTRIVGFCEPTMQECVLDLVSEMRATRLGGSDPASLEKVLRRRRGDVDVDSLPWKPRAEYVEWLQRQGRLSRNE